MKTSNMLFYLALAIIVYKIFNITKERFALSTAIILDKTTLDSTKYYDVGTLKSTVNPTQTPGINSTKSCTFPTTVYKLSATVDPVCADNLDANYTFGTTPQLGSALKV